MAEESREAMMRRLYHDEGCSIAELSAYFGCTRGDVRSWLMTLSERSWPTASASLPSIGLSLMADGCNAEEAETYFRITRYEPPAARP